MLSSAFLPSGALTSAQARLAQSWRLWFVLVVAGTALNFLVLYPAGFAADSTLRVALALLWRRPDVDSWEPMLAASNYFVAHPETTSLYQAIFFDQHLKFQYPLTSLLIIDIPRALGIDLLRLLSGLQLLSRLSVIGIGVTFALLLKNAVTEVQIDRQASAAPRSTWLAFVAGVLSAGLFFPISRSEWLGQIQTLMTLLSALSLLAWQRGAKGTAGLLLGLCCIFKPHWAIVILWALLRRQWRFVAAATLVGMAFLLIAFAVYGVANVMGYVAVAEYIARHGESYFANQSVNGLVNRWLFNGTNLIWEGHSFAPFHPVVRAATVASTTALLAFALLWGLRAPRQTTLHLALVMLALTMASPIAWEHHYGVVFPVFALLLPAALTYRPLGKATLPILALAFLLTSQSYFPLTNLLASSRWNILQSYLLVGGLLTLLLVALAIASRYRAEERTTLSIAASNYR